MSNHAPTLQAAAARAGITLRQLDLPEGVRAIYVRTQARPSLAVSERLAPPDAAVAAALALGHHFTGGHNHLRATPDTIRRDRALARDRAIALLAPPDALAAALLRQATTPAARDGTAPGPLAHATAPGSIRPTPAPPRPIPDACIGPAAAALGLPPAFVRDALAHWARLHGDACQTRAHTIRFAPSLAIAPRGVSAQAPPPQG